MNQYGDQLPYLRCSEHGKIVNDKCICRKGWSSASDLIFPNDKQCNLHIITIKSLGVINLILCVFGIVTILGKILKYQEILSTTENLYRIIYCIIFMIFIIYSLAKVIDPEEYTLNSLSIETNPLIFHILFFWILFIAGIHNILKKLESLLTGYSRTISEYSRQSLIDQILITYKIIPYLYIISIFISFIIYYYFNEIVISIQIILLFIFLILFLILFFLLITYYYNEKSLKEINNFLLINYHSTKISLIYKISHKLRLISYNLLLNIIILIPLMIIIIIWLIIFEKHDYFVFFIIILIQFHILLTVSYSRIIIKSNKRNVNEDYSSNEYSSGNGISPRIHPQSHSHFNFNNYSNSNERLMREIEIEVPKLDPYVIHSPSPPKRKTMKQGITEDDVQTIISRFESNR